MDESQVRSDLKKLAKKNKYIKVLYDTIEDHKRKLQYVSDEKLETELNETIKKFDKVTKDVVKLEEKYLKYIFELDDYAMQSAVLGHYVLCKPTWKVASELSYSDSAVEKMYPKACREIAEMMNKKARN